MIVVLGIILYLIIGLICALVICFGLLSEDDLPEKKSEMNLVIAVCIVFWIVLMPGIIYNNLKGGNDDG